MLDKDKRKLFDNQILENKSIWTVKDMMEFTGLARQTIYNKCSKEEIPSTKKWGKRYFDPEEIINLILEGD